MPRPRAPHQAVRGDYRGYRMDSTAPRPVWLIAAFIALSLAVPLISLGVILLETPRLVQDKQADLAAIAQLKSSQIETWLAERLADGRQLQHRDGLIEHVERWLVDRDQASGAYVEGRLRALHDGFGYRAGLIDARSVGAIADPARQRLAAAALARGTVLHGDMYRNEAGEVGLDFAVPLAEVAPGGRQSVGVLLLFTAASKYLFPLIQTWPTPSPSAETLLVARDGDEVVFLNELRHDKHTALTLRMPIAAPDLPAAVVLREGRPRVLVGRDYRGVEVVAAVQPVGESGWFLVAKMDRREVLEPMLRLVTWVTVVSLVAVLVVAGVTYRLWRQEQRAHALERAASAAERDGLLGLFYRLPFTGMAFVDPASGRWLRVNDSLCDMTGYSREELLGLTWMQLNHPDDLPARLPPFADLMAGRTEGYQEERRLVRKDGTAIDAEVHVRGVSEPDGRIRHVIMTVRDITDFKRAREALQESEARFRLLVEQATDGIFLSDPDGRFIEVNSAGAEMLDYSREELLHLTIADVVQPEEVPRIAPEVARFDGGWVVRSEWQFRRKDGSSFVGEVMGRRLPDGRLQAIVRDITERKRAESRRIEAMERQRDSLVREVHHRIKNHLQGVVTLLRNRAAELPAVAGPLEEAIGQINTIAQIYGLQGRDGAVSLGRIAGVAVASLAGPARIEYDAPADDGAMRVTPQEVVPVALVINELVTNAAKHTLSADGRVQMSVAGTANGARLRIANGPANLPPGFDFGSGQGFGTGLELLRALLPPKGAALSLREESDRVVAELTLEAPVLEGV